MSDEGKVTASDIKEALMDYYAADKRQWVCLPELKMGPSAWGSGTASRRDNDRAIDMFVMNMYASKNYRRIAFEIKISRSDFLAEIKNPIKRRPALLISNEFYFITPPGLLKKEEIPMECGLMEMKTAQITTYDGQVLREYLRPCVVLPAPWRDQTYPSWAFFASICRRIAKCVPVSGEEAQDGK